MRLNTILTPPMPKKGNFPQLDSGLLSPESVTSPPSLSLIDRTNKEWTQITRLMGTLPVCQCHHKATNSGNNPLEALGWRTETSNFIPLLNCTGGLKAKGTTRSLKVHSLKQSACFRLPVWPLEFPLRRRRESVQGAGFSFPSMKMFKSTEEFLTEQANIPSFTFTELIVCILICLSPWPPIITLSMEGQTSVHGFKTSEQVSLTRGWHLFPGFFPL